MSICNVDESRISCGVRQMYGLPETKSLKTQLQILEGAFQDIIDDWASHDYEYDEEGNPVDVDEESEARRDPYKTGFQIIFSDTVGGRGLNACPDLKELSTRGPITVNPNSGNKIQVYIATSETLQALKDRLDKQLKENAEKKAKTKPTKAAKARVSSKTPPKKKATRRKANPFAYSGF